MSSLYRQKSFRMLKEGIQNQKLPPIQEHSFIFRTEEINSMLEDGGDFAVLAEMGGVQGLAAAFRSNIKSGLFADEVDDGTFARRRHIYGANQYPVPPLKPFWQHCWECFTDDTLLVLTFAGVLSLIVGAIEHPTDGWHEGLAILIAVILVTLVGAGNNYHQELQFRALDADKAPPICQVRRKNKQIEIFQEEINVGDLVFLKAGDYIPCDGVMVTDEALVCDESQMTGEPKGIPKDFYHPFLKAGTAVREGECCMLCVAVGTNTEYGRLMQSLAVAPKPTPLQDKLSDMGALIGKFGSVVALALFLVLFIRWLVRVVDDKDWEKQMSELIDFFIVAVTVIVVAVPEGLPLAVTISLAYSMKRMFADKNLVRVLSACETMGNCTTICSDKTGTLTQNLMTVTDVILAGQYYGKGRIPGRGDISDPVKELLVDAIVINSKTYVDKKDMLPDKKPEEWEWKDGNQTEQSLMAWIVRYDVDIEVERDRTIVEKSIPFDSTKKRSSVVVRHKGVYRQFFKGAAENILDMCDKTVDQKGNVSELDKPHMTHSIEGFTCQGLRTLAFAYIEYSHLDMDENQRPVVPEDPTGLVFIGVVGIKDPLRPESRASVRECQRAGIIVRMVTGDHKDTANFIAKECGIVTDEKEHLVMLGSDFRAMHDRNDPALDTLLPKLRVLARSRPDDKKKLVELLQRKGEVVAATGDGTNDAPALKAANVGIAMFLTGTDVAKMAAQIQILDDNFASIVSSVMWGRSVYDNIRKFVQFQLTVNVVALTLTLIGAFTDFQNPLKAVQLLWVNLIMDTMAALALGTEIPTRALLDRMPYKPSASLLSPVMIRNILAQSAFQLAAAWTIMYAGEGLWGVEYKSTKHYTLIFNTFVFMQLFNEINSRKVNDELNVFDRLHTNAIFIGIMIVTVGMQILMVEVFGPFAETTSLTWAQWLTTIAIGAMSLVVGFFVRLIPVDYSAGRVVIPPDTFKGANLDVYEEGERHFGTAGTPDDILVRKNSLRKEHANKTELTRLSAIEVKPHEDREDKEDKESKAHTSV